MLTAAVAQPFLRRRHLLVAEHVVADVEREDAALVHPGTEIRRDGDVRRGRHDPGGKGRVAARELVPNTAESLLGRPGAVGSPLQPLRPLTPSRGVASGARRINTD